MKRYEELKRSITDYQCYFLYMWHGFSKGQGDSLKYLVSVFFIQKLFHFEVAVVLLFLNTITYCL